MSPGCTGTGHCATMRPWSYCSSTRCTVAPLNRAPLASTASCTRRPYMPGPPKAGNSAGWMLSIRSRKAATTASGTFLR
ncbi:MAG: hypothetical protein A3I79_01450 [Gemmatimonadetes bacterium RIFCSPLOWO2_02_FULL_71_11]|nr:MAG: hypothetical protein A3I79_01450 [Gemmatimonadetes bacterium RIFCSPLOWO2_02_FULL_71_11]